MKIKIGGLGLVLLMVASHAFTGIDQDLLAFWSFDQEYEDQVGTNHLIPGTGVNLVPGRFGNAVSLDGSAQSYLATAAPTNLAMGTQSFSVSMWIRPSVGNKNNRLMDHRGTGPAGQHSGWQLRIRQANGSWHFRGAALDDGAGNYKACHGCGGNYLLEQWYHVVMIYRAGVGLEFYVDGQLDGVKTVESFASITNAFPLVLGGAIVKKGVISNSANQSFKGEMDEVRIYGRALDSSEVFALYGQPITPANPSFTQAYLDYIGEFAAASHSLGFFYLDSDTSGNGIPDFFLIGDDQDLDGDGLANRVDPDDDGDGIADVDDKAGYNVSTGSQAGFAPLTGITPASFFKNGTQAAAAGLHPDDFWQFVPNGTYEQLGTSYTDANGTVFPNVYQNPAAYLYIDQYNRLGNLVSDGIPDILQAAVGSNTLPAFALETDHQTVSVDRTTILPGLLGQWLAGETGQIIFYLADDDSNTIPSPQFASGYPYSNGITDSYSTADGRPDYDLYGTTNEMDPAIPASLLADDAEGVRLWRYRKLLGSISDAREVVYFLTVYWNAAGRTNQTYYSRGEFNETFGNFGRNARTSGDGYGLESGMSAVGSATPNNWFPHFRNLAEHNLAAQYAFGQDWAAIATTPYDGSVPVALHPTNQMWVNRFENYSTANRIINHVDLSDLLNSLSTALTDRLWGRYGFDLTGAEPFLIRREEGGNQHLVCYGLNSGTHAGTLLAWEDFFALGDRSYIDAVFFTNRAPNP